MQLTLQPNTCTVIKFQFYSLKNTHTIQIFLSVWRCWIPFLFFIWWKYWYILNLICILLNHTLLLQNSGNLVIKFRLLSPTRKVNLSSRNMSGFSNYPLKPVKGCSQTRPNPSRVLKQSKTHRNFIPTSKYAISTIISTVSYRKL